MAKNKKPSRKSATCFLSIRVTHEQKRLIEEAAQSVGLQISSFIIMLFVRWHILPESYLRTIKRRPVRFFSELHALLGTLNNIGGNCKQLLTATPELTDVRSTQAAMQRAADAVTDALHGKAIPASVDMEPFEKELTNIGTAFNLIVRSVNMGRPELNDLAHVLKALTESADDLTMALSGKAVASGNKSHAQELARKAMQADMRKTAAHETRKKDR